MNDLEFFSLLDVSREQFESNTKQMVLEFLMEQTEYMDLHCKRNIPEPINDNFIDMMFTATEKAIKILRDQSAWMTRKGVDVTNKEMGL